MKKLYYLIRNIFFLNYLSYFFLKSKIRPFILCYHQIEEKEFDSHLRKLNKFFRPQKAPAFFDGLNKTRNSLNCIITIDDCITEDVERAVRCAEKNSTEIIYFLPLQYSEKNRSIWPNLILKALQQLDIVKYNDIKYEVITQKLKRSFADKILHDFTCNGMQTSEIELYIEKWLGKNGLSCQQIETANIKVIPVEYVKSISSSPYVNFQSHCVTHPYLYLCNEKETEFELAESKRGIENITGKAVDIVCYPYGSKKVIGDLAIKSAKKHYKYGVTLVQGVCDKKADLYQLPRIGIYPGDSWSIVFTKIMHYQEGSIFRS